ncbi:MAG: acyltransferase [Candidatus Puniceispirillales bacterium WSBS_2018_MAG_OTU23]
MGLGSILRFLSATFLSIKIRLVGFVVSKMVGSCGYKPRINLPLTIFNGKKVTIGNNFNALGNLYLHANDGKIEIGDDTSINTNVIIGSSGANIKIGNNVLIGPNVVFRAADHVFERADILIREQGHIGAPIVVEDDVWIASNAVILKGVTLKKGCVIAAGAVVTNDVEQYTVVGGVPAKVISTRKFK